MRVVRLSKWKFFWRWLNRGLTRKFAPIEITMAVAVSLGGVINYFLPMFPILFLLWFIPALGLVLTRLIAFAIEPYNIYSEIAIELETQLKPSIEIDSNPKAQPLFSGPKKKVQIGVLYFFSVTSTCGTTLRDVEIQLMSINPLPPDFLWLPVPLQIKHESHTRRTFDLSPRAIKQIDLVVISNTEPVVGVLHTVPGVDINWRPRGEEYVLTVTATASNLVDPTRRKFVVRTNPQDRLVCEPFSG